MELAPKRPPTGDDSETRPVLIDEDETLTRVCWSDSRDEESTSLLETRRLRRESAFVLPPPGALPRRRAPRTAPAKPRLRVSTPAAPVRSSAGRARPSAPEVPPPPSQPVLWRIPDESQLGDTPVPHSSGVRASRTRETPEPRRSRPCPPPPPSRAGRASAAAQLVMSTPGSETAAVTTVPPPMAARPAVRQEPLVQLQNTEPRMFTQPAPVVPVEAAVTMPAPEGWSDCWVAQPSSIPPMVQPVLPMGPFSSPPPWVRTALPALVCLLSLLTGLALAFVVFLGWAPRAVVESSVTQSARSLTERAHDAWQAENDEEEPVAAATPDVAKPQLAPPHAAAPRPAIPPRAATDKPAKKKSEKKSDKPRGQPKATAETKAGPGGTININSLPSSKAILDGRPVGNTPVMGLSVDAGPHTVTFVHPKYGKASVSVRVAPGKTAVAAHRFPFRRGD